MTRVSGTTGTSLHTGVYRDGMARQKLYRADVAEMAGISVRSLGRVKLPSPDGVDVEAGHARPWWFNKTIVDWYRARPGKGWRKGRTGGHAASR